jgi:hypothetical protein
MIDGTVLEMRLGDRIVMRMGHNPREHRVLFDEKEVPTVYRIEMVIEVDEPPDIDIYCHHYFGDFPMQDFIACAREHFCSVHIRNLHTRLDETFWAERTNDE